MKINKIKFKITDKKLSLKEIERLKKNIELWDRWVKDESKIDDDTLRIRYY